MPAPARGVQVGNKARSHLLSSPRGPGVRPSPLQPSSCQSRDTGTASAPTPVPPRFAVGWERGSSAAKARVGSAQLRGAQAAISREGWGEQGTHSKGQEEGGSITHPHRPPPWPWGYQAEPGYQSQLPPHPSKLHTCFGVLGGPRRTIAGE